MVAVHLDRRLAARVDPSDIVQEALADADRGLVRLPPRAGRCRSTRGSGSSPGSGCSSGTAPTSGPEAQRRSRGALGPGLARGVGGALADRLMASGTSPSRRLIRDELRRRVRAALESASPRDREILVMRHLEEMSAAEIAAILGISEGAARARLMRALARLRGLLGEDSSQGEARP